MGGKREDLTGLRFGRLTVICRAPNRTNQNGSHYSMWLCKCDCGNEKEIRQLCLKNGNTTSCGCYQNERQKARRKYNDFFLNEEYGIGYTTRGEKFLFDIEDYQLIKDYCWFFDSNGYVATHKDNKTIISLHRLVMGDPPNLLVDHIGGNDTKFDNRKSNLRIVTHSQNGMNHRLPSNNTSGTSGVHYDKHLGKWVSRIIVNNEKILIGYFDNKEDAASARKKAEERYYGEYSYDHSQNMVKGGDENVMVL